MAAILAAAIGGCGNSEGGGNLDAQALVIHPTSKTLGMTKQRRCHEKSRSKWKNLPKAKSIGLIGDHLANGVITP